MEERDEFSFLVLSDFVDNDTIYKIIAKLYTKDKGIDIIVNYINHNFKNCNKDNSCIVLNKLALLLNKSNIDYTVQLQDELSTKTPLLNNCLSIIITNSLFDELNDLALEFVENYYYSNDNIIYNEQLIELDDSNMQEEPIYEKAGNYLIQDIKKIPLLSDKETYELAKKYQETRKKVYRDKLITHNLKLIIPIARKYCQGTYIDIEDLIVEGTIGLMRAIEDYDPEKAKFSTYATWWIKQRIIRHIIDTHRNIRIPVHKYEKLTKYKKTYNSLFNKLFREPTDEEVAQELNTSVDKILEYKLLIQPIKSLNDTIKEDSDDELLYFIPSDDLDPEEINVEQNYDELNTALNKLTDTQRHVIELRFGLIDGKTRTLEEVCEDLYKLGYKKIKLTRERTRQIEAKSLAILKKHLLNEKHRKKIEDDTKYTEQYLNKKLSTLIKLLKETNREILEQIFNGLPKIYITLLFNYFDIDFNKKEEEIPYPTKEVLVTKLLPVIIHEKDRLLSNNILGNNNEFVLPINIYYYFDVKNNLERTKEEVNKYIDRLTPDERYLLSKYYDIYNDTGVLLCEVVSDDDKIKIIKILKSLEFNMSSLKHKVYKQKKKSK